MNQQQYAFYTNKKEKYTNELKLVSFKLKRFAWYRFISFVLIFTPIFIFGLKSWLTLGFSLFFIILFFILIKKNIHLDKRKKKIVELKRITENELLALGHSFSHFYNGKEFLDIEHFFSYDLDLFGEGSLFQFINRTSTVGGRHKLANWFLKPPTQKELIEKKQEAVKELALIPNWRIHFLANGQLFAESESMSKEIKSWSKMVLQLKRPGRIKLLIILIPLATFIAAVPAILGISNFYLVSMVIVQLILMYFFWKRITQYFNFFGRKTELLAKYMQLLEFIEQRDFQAEFLLELQKKVRNPVSASKIFKQLKSLVKELEYRQNILVGFALNSFLLWDIRCVYQLWKWHQKNHEKLEVWLDVISEFDALISIANYANNQSDFTYPKIHDGGYTFQATELGHPLLHPDKRICSDIEINGWSKVMIITGANMAGKSTFLRTVGVNQIIARIGAPVCAKEITLTPIEIYTNMRTTDSLLKDESYFYAELKRIKGVLDKLENGERIFVILDEMLKGTNSIDKFNGSKELIRKLIQFKSVSLIATHDLKLSELENEFPQQIFNKCFEIRIENNELVFDYLLTDGATKTMNATFLMKKMGII